MEELFSHLALGLSVAFTAQNLLYCLLGCLMGSLIGILPGIGPIATVALLLPTTFGLPPETALIMLAGIYYGAQYGGSTTAILVNLPGETAAVVTTIDGYQMARKGRAGPALAAAAIGSVIAGTFGTMLLAAFAIPLTSIAFAFGPIEYFSLMVLGLVAAVIMSSSSLVNALGMVIVGLLISMIGTDVNSGVERFTLGSLSLRDGVELVAIAGGIFGLGEIIKNLSQTETKTQMISGKISHLYPSLKDLKAMMPAIARGTGLGSMLGVLPGGGIALSSFASYAIEMKTRVKPGEVPFGEGNIRGVAAPESANNAAAQTSFIPLLTLGLPTNGTMALMIGAMMMHNVQPGPKVIDTNPELFWGLIASMWIGNVMLVILNLPLVGLWTKLLAIPYRWLSAAIVVFACIGVYSVNYNPFDLWMLGLFAIVGTVLTRLGCEPVPLLLGVILGHQLEESLRRGLLLSRGDWSVLVTSPISAAMLLTAVTLILLAIASPWIRKRRQMAFVEVED